jgi:3-oxoadipate enol-lactonase
MAFGRFNNQTLHFRDENPRRERTFVFINSLGTDLRIWDDVAAYFGTDYRLIRYDLRGHGLSDAPAAPYSIEDHVGDLAALLDAREIKGAIVVGLSVGGMIAQGLAAQRPELARLLVLCDTAHKIGTEDMWNARIEAVRTSGVTSIADAVIDRWFGGEFRRRYPADLIGFRNMLIRTPEEGYVGTCMTLRDTDLTTAAKSLTQQTLCLVGDEDKATPPELVKSLSALIPNSVFKTISSTAHLPCVERPRIYAAKVEAFIRRNWSA